MNRLPDVNPVFLASGRFKTCPPTGHFPLDLCLPH
jgi:hypothetical protein